MPGAQPLEVFAPVLKGLVQGGTIGRRCDGLGWTIWTPASRSLEKYLHIADIRVIGGTTCTPRSWSQPPPRSALARRLIVLRLEG